MLSLLSFRQSQIFLEHMVGPEGTVISVLHKEKAETSKGENF